MIVNVEFFDENPIENVVTSLNYKVDKTLFFGYESMVEENKRCVEKFLKEICGVQEVEFCIVDDVDLAGIMDTISNVVNHDLELGKRKILRLLWRRVKMPSEEKRIWGIHTKDDNLFLHQDVIAIGWKEMGDLSQIQADRDAFKEKYTEVYPDAKKGSIANGAGML